MKTIGLYLHFPFCIQKCRYCDFPSYAGRENRMIPYLRALFREMESYASLGQDYEIGTIFMGGGTPTLYDGDSLVRVLDQCRACFPVRKDAEITVECNPGTADRFQPAQHRAAGMAGPLVEVSGENTHKAALY